MKAKEPIVSNYNQCNPVVQHLRNYIVEKVEDENDLGTLEQIYSIISHKNELSFEEKYALAKEQTDKYCPEELAKELEAEGYMIDKPYPYDDYLLDLDKAIEEDDADGNAPQEWIHKMFPELHV